jgi:hypothetical protein
MVVVHVMHLPSLSAVGEATTPSGLAAVEAALEQTETHVRAEVADRLSGIELGWSFEPASGDPAAELIRVAAARHADAIVVGGKSHGVLGRLLLGSVAAKLVRRSVGPRADTAPERVTVEGHAGRCGGVGPAGHFLVGGRPVGGPFSKEGGARRLLAAT